jgi:hypothetical protein
VSTTTRPRRSKPKTKGARSGRPTVMGEARPYRPDVSVAEACASACNAAFAYCLTRGGDHVEEHHLKSLADCMEVCQLTATLVSRGSRYGDAMRAVCADACHDVATSCARFTDDPGMVACGDAARRAEAWCQS